MNIVWIVIDGLSFDATPFAEDGPATMPGIERLSRECGTVFTNAYAPGPLSPSSHAAMLTGRCPSAAGMYEAHPYFENGPSTIASVLNEEFRTRIITGNEWVFQGLADDFDESVDLGRQYLSNHTALDPAKYFTINSSRPLNFLKDAAEGGTLIKSMQNLISFRSYEGSVVQSRQSDDTEEYQTAESQANHIREWLSDGSKQFIFANFMDVHPPIVASDAALVRFSDGAASVPMGKSSERHLPDARKSYDVDEMAQLYNAAVWDVDRKLTPLIDEMLKDDTFVILTADHGRVDTGSAYSDQRLRVPLILFPPGNEPSVVDHTVSLSSIAHTLVESAGIADINFEGQSLLETDENQICVTEIIHHPNDVFEKTHRVDITRLTNQPDEDIQHDVVVRQGGVVGVCRGGEFECVSGNVSDCDMLRIVAEDLRSQTVSGTRPGGIEYDSVTKRRLEDLGYL